MQYWRVCSLSEPEPCVNPQNFERGENLYGSARDPPTGIVTKWAQPPEGAAYSMAYFTPLEGTAPLPGRGEAGRPQAASRSGVVPRSSPDPRCCASRCGSAESTVTPRMQKSNIKGEALALPRGGYHDLAIGRPRSRCSTMSVAVRKNRPQKVDGNGPTCMDERLVVPDS